jgi:hypothetical protein
VNWVKIGDTKGITKYIKTTKQKITQEGALRSRRVDPGDFILTNSMSFGRPYIMATTGYIHDGWFVFRIKEHINTDYFYHLLSSRIIQEQFGVLAAGAVVKNISSDLVKRAVLPIPPMDQQVEIVNTVELLSEQIQVLESIYERKLTALTELKQSLLQKAFTGELTTKVTSEVVEVDKTETVSPEFTASIIALAYDRHAAKKRDKTFGRVKAQKILHLSESVGGLDLGRTPIKDAAGPNDFKHMLRAEDWARLNHFFEFKERGTSKGYDFIKLKSYDKLLADAAGMTKPYAKTLGRIIDLLLPMNTLEAEVFTTVHAAWNNLLLGGVQATDDIIIREARENWHPDKSKIPLAKFRNAIRLIRDRGLVPDGQAKLVVGQELLF